MNIEIESKKGDAVKAYQTKTEHLHIRCTQEQKDRMQRQADRLDMTISQYIMYLVKRDEQEVKPMTEYKVYSICKHDSMCIDEYLELETTDREEAKAYARKEHQKNVKNKEDKYSVEIRVYANEFDYDLIEY